MGGNNVITDSTFTNSSSSLAASESGGAVSNYGTGALTNCVFADNTCGDCGGNPTGGAIYNGDYSTLVIEGCTFVVPANTSAGNNDLFTGNDSTTTFACPPGTKGTPVTLPGGPHLIKQLPPSTEIVHCAVVKYTCENGGQPNAKCVPDPTGGGLPLPKCNIGCLPP
jgi:hypothetical protein